MSDTIIYVRTDYLTREGTVEVAVRYEANGRVTIYQTKYPSISRTIYGDRVADFSLRHPFESFQRKRDRYIREVAETEPFKYMKGLA